VKFPETSVAGVPITSYAPESAAARAYRQLGSEVLHRIDPDSVQVGEAAVDGADTGGGAAGAGPDDPQQLALG
jgi:MinD-like ATPase involved in chromosome partitioning or flagellar assembly